MKFFNKFSKKTKRSFFITVSILTLCYFLLCCPLLLLANLDLSNKDIETLEYLKIQDDRYSKRITTLENKLNEMEADKDDLQVNKTAEEYKTELKDLAYEIDSSVSKNGKDYFNDIYTLVISVNKNENKSIIRIINNIDNHIVGEKTIEGTLEGGYGGIKEYVQSYNKIIFTIGPFFGICEPGIEKEGFNECAERNKKNTELYKEIGGLWYFDVDKKEFVQLAKDAELYDPSINIGYNY